jgi:hypothetical protein
MLASVHPGNHDHALDQLHEIHRTAIDDQALGLEARDVQQLGHQLGGSGGMLVDDLQSVPDATMVQLSSVV